MNAAMSDVDLVTLVPAGRADARGVGCPGPLLEAKKAMSGVPVGEVLELWSSDPDSKKDVAAWANKVGHVVLGVVPEAGYDRIFIRRGR